MRTLRTRYVYLLVDADELYVKIGISRAPWRRIYGLKWPIDRVRSLQFDMPYDRALKVERELHKSFEHYRVRRGTAAGSTEWFRLECLPLVVAYLRTHQAAIGWITSGPVKGPPGLS